MRPVTVQPADCSSTASVCYAEPGTIKEPPSSTNGQLGFATWKKSAKHKQKVIARLIRQWISSDANRRQLRYLLGLPTDAEMPREHRSLLDELDRKLNQ